MANKEDSTYIPPASFRFAVLVLDESGANSKPETHFKSVSGLESEIETEPIQLGGENLYTYSLPKVVKYSPLILSRGLATYSSPFTDWYWKFMNTGEDKLKVPIRHLLVSLISHDRNPIISWLVWFAYPVSWKVSEFNAQNNEIAIEEVKIVYRNFEIVRNT